MEMLGLRKILVFHALLFWHHLFQVYIHLKQLNRYKIRTCLTYANKGDQPTYLGPCPYYSASSASSQCCSQQAMNEAIDASNQNRTCDIVPFALV
ncbi:hypothetical protein AMTRI_Chr02g221750 [Amborella trichopoda]